MSFIFIVTSTEPTPASGQTTLPRHPHAVEVDVDVDVDVDAVAEMGDVVQKESWHTELAKEPPRRVQSALLEHC
jgi:hypothetical protein